jgi:hypothetical protein
VFFSSGLESISIFTAAMITRNKNEGFKGNRYACSEKELYKKVIEPLDKCKVDARVRAPRWAPKSWST